MGPDRASTLLSLPPPSGWGDVATKQDLHGLERRVERLEERLAGFERHVGDRFDTVQLAIERQTSRYLRWLFLANGAFLAAMAAGASIAAALGGA